MHYVNEGLHKDRMGKMDKMNIVKKNISMFRVATMD